MLAAGSFTSAPLRFSVPLTLHYLSLHYASVHFTSLSTHGKSAASTPLTIPSLIFHYAMPAASNIAFRIAILQSLQILQHYPLPTSSRAMAPINGQPRLIRSVPPAPLPLPTHLNSGMLYLSLRIIHPNKESLLILSKPSFSGHNICTGL